MRLLSKELVSSEYLESLRQDLSRAAVCRFLVAYISDSGLTSIGYDQLVRVLRSEESFGVGSLTCACGYEPLLRLQGRLDTSVGVRLKYFMDPLIEQPDEPTGIALFHSKLAYLRCGDRSIVYIGSHNWTRQALGPGGPRNAEASLRFEAEYQDGDLKGTGPTLAAAANGHLLQAYELAACLPAIESNRVTFEQWYEKGCKPAPPVSLQKVTILLTVRKEDQTTVSPSQWQELRGHGIYVQVLGERDGQRLWQDNNRVLVFVWESRKDLQAGRQPICLRCRITTNKAGPESRLHGTNQSTTPIAGFEAVIFDESELATTQQTRRGNRTSIRLWSGREVEFYDFEFPTPHRDSSHVDGTVVPKYQFHLEVEYVVFPADGIRPESPEMVWERESFAVAKSKKQTKYEQIPGYLVPQELNDEIRQCLAEILKVVPDQARVLPVSEFDHTKAGRRVSSHPLHETFMGRDTKERQSEFYARTQEQTLVADLDSLGGTTEDASAVLFIEEQHIGRVQRVLTLPLRKLEKMWREKAARFQSRR
jgi:hypothetical protein